jgi:hypothetical protein
MLTLAPSFPRRSALVAALLCAAALPLAAQADTQGRWSIEHDRADGLLQLELRAMTRNVHNDWQTSFEVKPAELAGLSIAALDGRGDSATFRLVRDAGTFDFRGRVGERLGIGTYAFTPNSAFIADLSRRGYGTASDQEAMRLAIGGIGLAYVARLDALHYVRPTIGELARLGTHGVTLDYLNAMAALGFNTRSAAELTRLRDHGVTPEYVSALKGVGLTDLAPADYVRARDHGVTPEYVREMRAAGYADLRTEEYVRARDHGVDGALATGFADVGYAKLPIETLIRMQDHGVTPAYARQVRRDGTAPTAEELVRSRDRGGE